MKFNIFVPIVVGFIALTCVAAEVEVLVLTFIDHELKRQRELVGERKLSN